MGIAKGVSLEQFEGLLEARRSCYQIDGHTNVSNEDIVALVTTCLRTTPSMFNMQSTRAVILFGAAHEALWDLCRASLPATTLAMRPNVGWQQFSTVAQKLDSLSSGQGTVLLFEDEDVIQRVRAQYPTYSANFDTWANQSSAICQYSIWLAFTASEPSIGATLQHYYPDMAEVRARWKIPSSWRMTGQMPFGRPVGKPFEKVILPDAQLVAAHNV